MSKKMFVYGRHACLAILSNPKRQIINVWLRQGDESRHQDLIALAQERQLNLQIQAQAYFQKNFADEVHQGIVIEVRALESLNEADLISHLDALTHPPLLLILDGVTDPHNLGACLRTADAAGVDMVIIPKDKSAGLSPIVTKVSSGASESVPLVQVTNLARAIEKIQQWGVWVYGACGEATESLYALEGRQAIALVLGSEGEGLRRLTREKCDGLFSIPMMGMVSSLNVSVAAGVSLYEIRRQRGGN
jgi:23S rRNA (guanosine2251-2'-O)-methyltransferase